ncbi:hypothetical protein [Streptomyces sp. NPDC102487]|uniref:hypothetical protein n=1 Tax=Streptomyces sp. NPDC102487 TaxID=3366182 RepID=UPI00381D84CC
MLQAIGRPAAFMTVEDGQRLIGGAFDRAGCTGAAIAAVDGFHVKEVPTPAAPTWPCPS